MYEKVHLTNNQRQNKKKVYVGKFVTELESCLFFHLLHQVIAVTAIKALFLC